MESGVADFEGFTVRRACTTTEERREALAARGLADFMMAAILLWGADSGAYP
jgi:hypothetical protein